MRSIGLADRLVVETEVAVTEFSEFLQPKIEVVHAYRLASAVDRKRSTNQGVQFVYAGHLTVEKGILDLIAAFSEISEISEFDGFRGVAELHVYGAGDDQIVKQMSQVQHLHYHGCVSQERLVAELSKYDVLVFPSAYENEGQPGVVVEALMAGIPVIATDLQGPLEILTHGANSLVTEVGNIGELASAMKELANDPELRMSLARQAKISGRQFDALLVLPKLANAVGMNVASVPRE